jgi:hypothetical protein
VPPSKSQEIKAAASGYCRRNHLVEHRRPRTASLSSHKRRTWPAVNCTSAGCVGLGAWVSHAKEMRRAWQWVEVLDDAGCSAKDMRRPGVQEALRVLKAGEASALVVAKLDRLSRSMLDFTALMAKAQKQCWALDVRAVRAAAHRAAHQGGARDQVCERRPARSSTGRRGFRRPENPAPAVEGRFAAADPRGLECIRRPDHAGRGAVVCGHGPAGAAPDVVSAWTATALSPRIATSCEAPNPRGVPWTELAPDEEGPRERAFSVLPHGPRRLWLSGCPRVGSSSRLRSLRRSCRVPGPARLRCGSEGPPRCAPRRSHRAPD